MAQPVYEYGGRQQGIPFLQHTDQYPGINWSNTYTDSADNFTTDQSILDQNDNAFMAGFWSDPDGANPVNNTFPWPGMDDKVGGGNHGEQLGTFKSESQMVHNPASSLAASSAAQYQTHTNNQLGQMASNVNFGGHEHGHGSEDDMKAASGLFNMSMHGHENSRALSLGEGVMTNAWVGYDDNAGLNNVHMQDNPITPMTSSGRQSANSYHGQHTTPLMTNTFQGGLNQQQMQHQFWMTYQQQQQMNRNPAGARHQSLQLETSPFNFQTNTPHVQMTPANPAYNQPATRPQLMRFGSDNSFSHTGYHGPHSNMSLEQEKEGNLVNVPLAAQAAANGFQHIQPRAAHMGPPGQFVGSQYPMRNNSGAFQSMSAASSPGGVLGGLPTNSPVYSGQLPGYAYHPAMQQPVGDEESPQSETVSDIGGDLSRKRRKSQLERNNNGDYASSHTKVTGSTRDARPSKHVATTDSDDEYVTPVKNGASKRRKSSMLDVRPMLGSGDGSSPATASSPAAKHTPASSRKKGGRGNDSRQNLTEDQKRRNHIQSEKQRRDLIKNHYDALDTLVPALKGGKSGLSRSDVLQEIVAYVESVQAGNDAMKAKLASLSLDDDASPADAEDDV